MAESTESAFWLQPQSSGLALECTKMKFSNPPFWISSSARVFAPANSKTTRIKVAEKKQYFVMISDNLSWLVCDALPSISTQIPKMPKRIDSLLERMYPSALSKEDFVCSA